MNSRVILTKDLLPVGRHKRQQFYERIIGFFLGVISLAAVVVLFGVAFALIPPTIDFFQDVSFSEFFGSTNWYPLFDPPGFGVWPLVVGTFVVMTIAIVVSVPGGLAISFYLNQYASDRARRILKPVLEILAGVPTVVFGFFAINFVSPKLVRNFYPFGDVDFYNALSAGLVVGIMILPMMSTLAEDAMNSVPQALADGAYALGATRREVCTSVIFPAALSGIIASANFSFNPGEAMQTMASFIGFAGIGDQPTDSTGYRTIFAVGAFLFIITFVLNILSVRFVRRFREVYE